MDELSVRADSAGGPVSDHVEPATWRPVNSRIVILIHGFNNTKKAAKENYTAFTKLLAALGVPEQSTYGQVVGFYWPGDAQLGKLSFLSYPTEMGPARRSAELLANFLIATLAPRGLPLQVILVCHSLGNRVALELIRVLGNAPRTWGLINGLCLMAAAVPVAMVEDISKLGRAARATRTRVLFSRSDTTLHGAFPPGETAAGEGFFPQAVGLFGNPIGLWSDRCDLQPYNHGDYFLGLGNDNRSAVYVARFLGAGVAAPLSSVQPISRGLPPTNSIPSRQIGMTP